ncbi:ABC transporter permease [Candidatus Sumerlaeota bacterium]|nr:ABC transporter permease [Candidatus Sumerlaeota bacterium]
MKSHLRKPRTALIRENTLLAFAALRDRWFRSLLAVMAVFIGILIIMGVASVLNGFRQGVVDGIEQFGTNNIYVTRFPPINLGRPDPEIRKRKQLRPEDAEAIRDECDAIEAVTPEIAILLSKLTVGYEGEEVIGPFASGMWASGADALSLEIDQGRYFTEEENARRAPVCVIGHEIVRVLFPGRNPIGKHVSFRGMSLRVVGTVAKLQDGPFGSENERDKAIYAPYAVMNRFFEHSHNAWISLIVRAKEGRRAEAIEQIEEVLRRRRHVGWHDPNSFEVNTSDSLITQFDAIVMATLAVMFALSSVAFLVGGVGVMNVMLASVKERTREIGVRRAIGARRRDIVWQFLTEAMAMTGVGGVLGVLAGESLAWFLHTFLPMVPCAVPMWARLFGVVGAVGIGLIFGLWPAIAAARLDPIEALRYE